MSYSARILADSVNVAGCRLTTFEITYPRMVHADFMTHRTMCLAGDAELEFDLPGGNRGRRRVFRMKLKDFADKWMRGARRGSVRSKRISDLSWIDPSAEYTATEVANKLGMASADNINWMCVRGAVAARKNSDGRSWLVSGESILRWRKSSAAKTRYDMRGRLSDMRIRQLNEDTGDIQWSHVVNVFESGPKEVFDVAAGDFKVAGSADHRVMTTDGWKTIGELRHGDMLVVRKFGKRPADRLDPMRLRKIGGIWRCAWQRMVRADLIAEDPACRACRNKVGEDVHHVIPVHEDPRLALERSNVTLLCDDCHKEMHARRGWQDSGYLYGAAVPVKSIERRGVEETYDLEIAGQYPNFIANGVVVHNSRNAGSSRAIPIQKMIAAIAHNPAGPVWWGKNQAGMQARVELAGWRRRAAARIWYGARWLAIATAWILWKCGVHKQIANRLLEPWMWITVIVSATDWANFFALRAHPDAQPEIQRIAGMMLEVYRTSTPRRLMPGELHLPLCDDRAWLEASGYDTAHIKAIATGRVARVSYLTHDGRKSPPNDIRLHNDLRGADPGHWSPFEHVATALATSERSGNFRGFRQYRKEFAHEAGPREMAT